MTTLTGVVDIRGLKYSIRRMMNTCVQRPNVIIAGMKPKSKLDTIRSITAKPNNDASSKVSGGATERFLAEITAQQLHTPEAIAQIGHSATQAYSSEVGRILARLRNWLFGRIDRRDIKFRESQILLEAMRSIKLREDGVPAYANTAHPIMSVQSTNASKKKMEIRLLVLGESHLENGKSVRAKLFYDDGKKVHSIKLTDTEYANFIDVCKILKQDNQSSNLKDSSALDLSNTLKPKNIATEETVTTPPAVSRRSRAGSVSSTEDNKLPAGRHSVFEPTRGHLFQKPTNSSFGSMSRPFKLESDFAHWVHSGEDFVRTAQLKRYFAVPELDSSGQVVRYTADENTPYIKFPVYANSTSLYDLIHTDKYLKYRTPEKIKQILAQIVKLLRTGYVYGLSHRDLHAENIRIAFDDNDAPHVYAIDIGNSKFARSMDDINYLCFGHATTVIETKLRALREEGDIRQLKHDPLGRLIAASLGIDRQDADKQLKTLGELLTNSLNNSSTDEDVYSAFNAFSAELLKWIDNNTQSGDNNSMNQSLRNSITRLSSVDSDSFNLSPRNSTRRSTFGSFAGYEAMLHEITSPMG